MSVTVIVNRKKFMEIFLTFAAMAFLTLMCYCIVLIAAEILDNN